MSSIFGRRHYEAIAETLRVMSHPANGCNVETVQELAKQFAHRFAADNSRFDRSKFIDACQVNTTYKNRSRVRA